MGALYGPYALGGAVNLVRRRDRRSRATFRVAGGTDERALVRARYAVNRGRWNLETVLRAETVSPSLGALQTTSRGSGVRGRIAHHPSWAGSIELSAEHRRDQLLDLVADEMRCHGNDTHTAGVPMSAPSRTAPRM